MSLMLGCTSAASVDDEPESSETVLVAGFLDESPNATRGFISPDYGEALGSITPVVPVRGVPIASIIDTLIVVGQTHRNIILNAPTLGAAYWDSVSITGIFQTGGLRTINHNSGDFAYTDISGASQWRLDFGSTNDDFMVENNSYDYVFNWTNP